MKKPEILAPAGSLDVLKTAVIYGADAVYIGGEAYGLRAAAHNFDKKEMQERTDKILDIIGLTDKKDVYPGELSVSAEQRVVIGRSFAVYPDLLLMDEPYGQMDIKVRYYLEDEVLKLWRETGSTVLFITHNIEEAIYLSQKCLIMSQKPTTIKAIVDNPLPYPRNVSDPEFIKLREEVTDMIKWW